MTKKEIRKESKERRKALGETQEIEKSEQIRKWVASLPEYQAAKTVYCYVDYNHEVHTWPIMKQALADGKRVAVPRVEGKEMVFCYITGEMDLEPGYSGILEPNVGLPIAEEENAFFIMPGVAFDKKHHRIGYGGGFYDRYLEKWPKLKTAAVAFSCQLFEAVPFEAFDILPQILVTENGISRL